MLLKPPRERCCGNQDRNKHTINLSAYQLSREAGVRPSSADRALNSPVWKNMEKKKQNSLKLQGD